MDGLPFAPSVLWSSVSWVQMQLLQKTSRVWSCCPTESQIFLRTLSLAPGEQRVQSLDIFIAQFEFVLHCILS